MITIEDLKETISKLASKYSITKVNLFGSYADGTANEESDIDLLVEFDTKNVSLIKLSALKIEITEELKNEVDIVHGPISEKSLLEIKRVIQIYEQ